MNPPDPLSKLLKNWQPVNPGSTERFVQDTMQRIHGEKAIPIWQRQWSLWTEILDDWLPSPNIWLPAAASFILLLTVIQWLEAEQRAKTMAAIQWRQELIQPLNRLSLTGTYAQLKKE